MRNLFTKMLKEMVLYLCLYVARLENAGQLHIQVQFDPNSVGWVKSEMLVWRRRASLNSRVFNQVPREDVRRLSVVVWAL